VCTEALERCCREPVDRQHRLRRNRTTCQRAPRNATSCRTTPREYDRASDTERPDLIAWQAQRAVYRLEVAYPRVLASRQQAAARREGAHRRDLAYRLQVACQWDLASLVRRPACLAPTEVAPPGPAPRRTPQAGQAAMAMPLFCAIARRAPCLYLPTTTLPLPAAPE
jgi:hypothetical protein